MQVKVIIGNNVVFATYYKTICFKQEFSNDAEFEKAYHDAAASALFYSTSGVTVSTEVVRDPSLSTEESVFIYLEARHAKKQNSISQVKKEAGEHLLDEEYWKEPY